MPDVYYNIDAGTFESDFTTKVGGISLTQGKRTTSSNSVTFFKESVYTVYFTLNAYIPFGGYLSLVLPQEISIDEWDRTDFETDSKLTYYTHTNDRNITFKAEISKVEVGSYSITFGKVINPRSVFDSGIFNMYTYD